MQERLQKILARAGFASRRGAEQLMLEGRVTVNGEPARELGTKADLAHDDVRLDGVRVKAQAAPVYLVLNKPRGIVSTRKDPEGRQTVMDLVPRVAGLFPVGRLDVTTEGLILLTTDGVFAQRIAHPRYEVPRVYHAKVHGVPDAVALERLRRGVRVGEETMAADRVRLLEAETNAWVELTLHEGKQHEVRRMLEAVGHPVSKLRRVAVGPVTTQGLAPGEFRALSAEELKALLAGEGARLRRPRLHPRAGRKAQRRGDERRGDARRGDARRGDARRGAAGSGDRRSAGPGEGRSSPRGDRRAHTRRRGQAARGPDDGRAGRKAARRGRT